MCKKLLHEWLSNIYLKKSPFLTSIPGKNKKILMFFFSYESFLFLNRGQKYQNTIG